MEAHNGILLRYYRSIDIITLELYTEVAAYTPYYNHSLTHEDLVLFFLED